MSERYYYSDVESATPFFGAKKASGPGYTPRQLLKHFALFLATCLTTTIAGAIFPYLLQENIELTTIFQIVTTTSGPLINGLLFSFTLLMILSTHEMGHYIACRYYGIKATLPYFIPVPPPLGIGTLGAFIRIKSPISTRKALFDVGLSGPLAGFIFALPAAAVGIYYGQDSSLTNVQLPITFNHPLLFTLLSKLLGVSTEIAWNPIWFACWVGMLATALNLLPVGQLDGGHVVYALFGRTGHRLIAVTITALQYLVAYFAYTTYNWAGGFVYAVMLTVLLILRHPQVDNESEPLGFWRKLLGIVGLLVFLLSFMPVPLRVN